MRPPDFEDSTARWEFSKKCEHEWQPVGIEFRRTYGGNGTCFVVCLKCGGHSYIETWWVGTRLTNIFDDEKASPEPTETSQDAG